MTNFNLAFPGIPFQSASVVSSHAALPGTSLNNLITGGRPEYHELATATADDLTIEFDLGSGNSSTAKYLGLVAAKMLKGAGCTRISLRGSTASAFTPTSLTGLKLWLDPNRQVSLASGAISQISDLSGLGNNATQGTSANRPVLSRGDDLENRLLYSETFSNAAWTKDGATIPGNVLIETATTSAHRIYQSGLPLISGILYAITFRAKLKDQSYIVIQVDNFSSYYYGVCFNLSAGTIGAKRGSEVATITAVGDGSYDCTMFFTPPAATTWTISAFVNNANNVTASYAGNTSNGIYLYRGHLRQASAGSGYPASGANIQYPGFSGNHVPVLNGTTHNLQTTYTPAINAGFSISAVIRMDAAQTGHMLAAYDASTGSRIQFYVDSVGNLSLIVHNQLANYIRRYTPNGTIALNTTYVVSATYDGTTSATGIKVYKNGTQVDTTSATGGTYTVPGTTGAILELGSTSGGTANRFPGVIAEPIFTTGTPDTSARQTVEAYLTAKYITAPAYSNYSLSSQTLTGSFSDDLVATFLTTAAYRYWTLQLGTDSTCTYPLSKALFGNWFDFAREPVRPFQMKRQRTDPAERDPHYEFGLTWEDVSDTLRASLDDQLQYAGTNPVLLYDAANLILPGNTSMYALLIDPPTPERVTVGSSDVTLTFEELI